MGFDVNIKKIFHFVRFKASEKFYRFPHPIDLSLVSDLHDPPHQKRS